MSLLRSARWTLAAGFAAILITVATLAAQKPAGDGKGFIWRIERDGRVGWLVGSLHVLTPDYYPLPDSMQKAFARATTLVEEADVNDISSPEVVELLRTRAVYTGGETLKTELSPETYQLAVSRLARFGLDMATFERMRPWMMTLTLVTAEMKRAGFDASLGVDRHFLDKAAPMGKKFRTLETLADQLRLFAGFSPKVEEAMLRDTLSALDQEMSQIDTVARLWRAGDAAGLERIVLAPMTKDPALYDALIVRRNRNWIPKIEACLAETECFVVVGAAHLIGPDGLLTTFKQRGYSVEQH